MGLTRANCIFEIASRALLGGTLFTFVLFLRAVSKLFEQLVRGSAEPETVGYLFTLLLPQVLTFTIPVGVLVGTLIALSRMSADAEVTAMRASGLSSRQSAPAGSRFGLPRDADHGRHVDLADAARRSGRRTSSSTSSSPPNSRPKFSSAFSQSSSPTPSSMSASVIPGPSRALAQCVSCRHHSAGRTQENKLGRSWRGQPAHHYCSGSDCGPEVERNSIQLTLTNGSTARGGSGQPVAVLQHIVSADAAGTKRFRRRNEAKPRIQFMAMDMGPLWRESQNSVEARIELHNRLVLPPACLLLALIGAPLGISSRKGGKSSAFVSDRDRGFLYYMGLVTLIGLARQQTLPVEVAMWLPNVILLMSASSWSTRMERPGDRDIIGRDPDLDTSGWLRFAEICPSAAPGAWTRRCPSGRSDH